MSHRGGFFFAHWCRRNHTEQVPTKFDELYSRVAALIKQLAGNNSRERKYQLRQEKWQKMLIAISDFCDFRLSW